MTPEDFDVSENDARKQFEEFLLEYPKMYSAQESHSRFQTFWENLKVRAYFLPRFSFQLYLSRSLMAPTALISKLNLRRPPSFKLPFSGLEFDAKRSSPFILLSANQIPQPHRARKRPLRRDRVRRPLRLRIPPPLSRTQAGAQKSQPKKIPKKASKLLAKAEVCEERRRNFRLG